MSLINKVMSYKDEVIFAGAIVTIIALGPAAMATIQARIAKR